MKIQRINELGKEVEEDPKEQKIKRKLSLTAFRINQIFKLFSEIFFKIEPSKKSSKKWIKLRKKILKNKKKLMKKVKLKLVKKVDL